MGRLARSLGRSHSLGILTTLMAFSLGLRAQRWGLGLGLKLKSSGFGFEGFRAQVLGPTRHWSGWKSVQAKGGHALHCRSLQRGPASCAEKGDFRPRLAVELVGAEAATLLHDHDNRIAKPPVEMEAVRGVVEPFWDEALRHNLTARKRFVEKLRWAGLVTLRARGLPNVGGFFVGEKNFFFALRSWIVDWPIRCTSGRPTACWPQPTVSQAVAFGGLGRRLL